MGVTLEDPAVLQLEDIVTGFLGMTVQLHHLGHEVVGMNELVQGRADCALVVARAEDLGRYVPHVGHLLIEAQNLPIEIDHEDPVGGRLEGRAQQGEGSAGFALRVAAIGDVVYETHQVQRVSSHRPHDGNRLVDPDDFPILTDVALLHPVLGQLTRANASDEFLAGRHIVGMREVFELELEDLFAGISGDLTVALIDGYPLFRECQVRNADSGLLESR